MSEATKQPVLLIAGITGGIGSAVARLAASSGWTVAGYARSEERLRAFMDDHSGAITYQADACQSAQVDAVVEKLLEKTGRIDAYLHCVGSIVLKPAHTCTDEVWQDTMRQNLDSAFYGLRAAVRPMMKAKSGSIVLISSVAACAGVPSHEPIAAAKAGIQGLVLSAAATYASKGIRVNAVAPGMVETPMAKPLLGSDEARKISESMHPLGRIGQPEDIASLLLYLADPKNSWITGQIWSADGGMGHLRQRARG